VADSGGRSVSIVGDAPLDADLADYTRQWATRIDIQTGADQMVDS
jgi:hypothetical protein